MHKCQCLSPRFHKRSAGIPVNLVEKLMFLWEETPTNFQYYQTNPKQMAIKNLNQVRLHVIPDFVLQFVHSLGCFCLMVCSDIITCACSVF